MKRVYSNNGLSLVRFGLFVMFEIGLSIVGQRRYNQERIDHRLAPVTFANYLVSADFMEATMENWESEFLQMFADGVMLVFSIVLREKGSPQYNPVDAPHALTGRDYW